MANNENIEEKEYTITLEITLLCKHCGIRPPINVTLQRRMIAIADGISCLEITNTDINTDKVTKSCKCEDEE